MTIKKIFQKSGRADDEDIIIINPRHVGSHGL